ncbi:MAG: hypothetical protein PT118_11495 [Aphanizomenon gracile PMC644.10]|nr:hypothetical protein [Aphanizomenon gracile PMC644.10]
MKFKYNLKPTVISLFTLAFLQVQNPAIALVNQEKFGDFLINLELNTSEKLSKKPPIQLAIDDYYWGPQRDFNIWMPGELIKNTDETLRSMNAATQTVYLISHKDMPPETSYLSSEEIREVLQVALRANISPNDKVVKSTNMVLKGYPGVELLVQYADGTQGQYQGYLVRRRFYILGAITSNELNTEVANFFDSFRVYPTRIVSY